MKVPDYLEAVYWWAYVRPWAIKLFERDWLVALILWGWYRPLEDAALDMLGNDLPGRTLQIACVYGEFVPKLCTRVEASGGELDVVDVVEAQLENLKKKLPENNSARLLQMDSSDMSLPSATYDRVILFFLMHEQPFAIRNRTISEAFRVVKPGGQVLFVEFSRARWWHPLRYIYLPLLKHFEPFAPDVWDHEDVEFWLTKPLAKKIEKRRFLFWRYYQVFSVRA